MAPATATSGETCIGFHGAVFLKDFAGGPPVNDVPSTFYFGGEGCRRDRGADGRVRRH